MSVAGIPPCEKGSSFVSNIVAIGVLKKKSIRGLMDDEAAIGEYQTCWNTEFVSKSCEFISNIVAVGILADDDFIPPLAGRL